ncbi:MAG: hypothetical protein IKC64_03385 [Clostridia bacterium]|nr:hypothetical protein [Clostridia bacterium]
MKKIGFIDYYISEWHANNYPAWIKNACDKLGLDYEIAYAWAEEDISPVDGVRTDEWCEKNGVTRCASIEELCQKADYLLILAPSNPEKHLGYAEIALRYGKRTYIDKTFTPDYATAKKIFDIAKENGTSFFSTSALRYASEIENRIGSSAITTTGGGGNLPEYIVHQAEMVVKTLGLGAKSVCAKKTGDLVTLSVNYDDGRSAVMNYAPSLPFTVMTTKDGVTEYRAVSSDFFGTLMERIVQFYDTGILPFDENETLEVMRIREMAINQYEKLIKE